MNDNMPPRDVPPGELFQKILERPRPSAVVDYPAKALDGSPLMRIRIMILGGDQQEEARFRAKEYLKSKRKMTDQELDSQLGVRLLGDAVARECIAMACYGVEPISQHEGNPTYPILFPTAAHVSRLPADEITVLFGLYCAVQNKFGPFEQAMSEAEVNAWIQRLEEGASVFPLQQLDSHLRDELCLRLSVRAAVLSKLLHSQQQNSPINWESIPETYRLDTSSPSGPAAESILSGDELITPEQAIEAARAMAKLSD